MKLNSPSFLVTVAVIAFGLAFWIFSIFGLIWLYFKKIKKRSLTLQETGWGLLSSAAISLCFFLLNQLFDNSLYGAAVVLMLPQFLLAPIGAYGAFKFEQTKR